MPVHKASSRIAGSSINNCCLFGHIGQTSGALSPSTKHEGYYFVPQLACISPYLPSNMSDWMYGHYDWILIALSYYYVIIKDDDDFGEESREDLLF